MNKETLTSSRRQRTLQRSVDYAGIGLHTGETVYLRLNPADENTGVVFRRTDIPGAPLIPARVPYVVDTSDRCTVLGNGLLKIYTVEHLMAALYANQIDNVIVDISNIEPPVGNGSSDVFVEMIQQAGIVEQTVDQPQIVVTEPVYFSHQEIHLVALPCDQYRISYTLNYPKSAALKSQYNSFFITPETFNTEISPCRTFCLYEEISFLMDKGLIKGGSLDNAVVIHGDAILSKNGLFFQDEASRHKILDVVGDLALIGCDIKAHIIAIRAGHAANFQLAKQLFTQFQETTNDCFSAKTGS